MKFLVIALFLFLGGCASGSDKVASSLPSPEQKQETEKAKAAWEIEWDRWIAEARKEGKVALLITGETAPHNAIKEGFEKKYNIKVELTSVGVGLVEGKLLSERRAGIYTTDLFFGGGTTMISVKHTGSFDPIEKLLVLPEVVDPKVWWRNKLDYLDQENYILAFLASSSLPWAINIELVRTSEEPVAWEDLLEPRWKTKILMGDPRIPGTANTLFTVIASRTELGLDFWRKVARQEPMVVRDQRLQAEWLAQGKYPILLSPPPSVKQFIDAGSPLKYLMPKGAGTLSSASGNIGLLNKAPHLNAAKIYVNYLLTKEGQTLYSVAGGYQSGRVDVPSDHLDPLRVRKPGIEYVFTSYEQFSLKTIEGRKQAMEIFGQ